MITRLLSVVFLAMITVFAAESRSILVYPGIIDIGMVEPTVDSAYGTSYVFSKNSFTLKMQSQNDLICTTQEVTLAMNKDGSVKESTSGEYRGYKVSIALSVKQTPHGKSIRKIVSFNTLEFLNERIELMLVGFKQ
ncbi:MAG: hypothetical protein OCD01_19270 [Fibrobacterales bacterium]